MQFNKNLATLIFTNIAESLKSQIRSRIEYLIRTYTILCFIHTEIDKNIALLAGHNTMY